MAHIGPILNTMDKTEFLARLIEILSAGYTVERGDNGDIFAVSGTTVIVQFYGRTSQEIVSVRVGMKSVHSRHLSTSTPEMVAERILAALPTKAWGAPRTRSPQAIVAAARVGPISAEDADALLAALGLSE